ncbi:MAG: biotin--[acetyl-CoA-carboxylase] ligase [Actinomycetes bacterium]
MIRASLDEEKITRALGSNYWRVRVLSETSSTQDELKTELVSNGDCVVTEFQSAGRGRLDRSFESDPHVALLFSFYIKPERKDSWGWIPLLSGLSVAQTINEVTSTRDYQTKWPNDLISASGKIAGILCERHKDGIIVGIGINVSTQVDELPVDTASSIFITSGLEIDRNNLLAAILRRFQDNFENWLLGSEFKAPYRALSATIGHDVKALLPSGDEIFGKAKGIGEDGELLLESGDVITVGDIVHLSINSGQ